MFGITSALRPTVVNDFRFNYQFWSNRNLFPTSGQCAGQIGCGYAGLTFVGSSLGSFVGDTLNATQGRDLRRYTYTDSLTWQKGKHRFHFGGEFEHDPGTGFWGYCDPGCEAVFSPEYIKTTFGPFASTFFPTLPSVINSNAALKTCRSWRAPARWLASAIPASRRLTTSTSPRLTIARASMLKTLGVSGPT